MLGTCLEHSPCRNGGVKTGDFKTRFSAYLDPIWFPKARRNKCSIAQSFNVKRTARLNVASQIVFGPVQLYHLTCVCCLNLQLQSLFLIFCCRTLTCLFVVCRFNLSSFLFSLKTFVPTVIVVFVFRFQNM